MNFTNAIHIEVSAIWKVHWQMTQVANERKKQKNKINYSLLPKLFEQVSTVSKIWTD